MRILVHDHAGHPFQAALARELASRGHVVCHVHCGTFESAKGAVGARPGDAPTLSFRTICHSRPFEKYRWRARLRQEVEYGRRAGRWIGAWRPDVVLTCNTPLVSQASITQRLRRMHIPVVSWVQDIYSDAAIDVVADGPMRGLGRGIARLLRAIEGRTMRQSAEVIAIAESFVPRLSEWGVERDRISVIPNWATIEDLPVRERPTPWEIGRGLECRFVFLYSGILGLKHDPAVLMLLAERFAGRAEVVVVARGPGRDRLAAEVERRGTRNLHLLDFEDDRAYPDVLGAADVLIALLTARSGRYSVPSKVLSYLCAGRPVLGVLPTENDAAAMIVRSGAGIVAEPGDDDAFLAGAERLFDDAELRRSAGTSAREFAAATFDTARSADRFEEILRRARSR